MRTTGKSNLKIIAACSVAIFSLLAVLGGAYSWFTLKMSSTIDSNDFAVVNLGSCDLYSIDLYKFEYSTTTHGTGESAFVVTDYLTPELGDVKKYSYDKELKQFGYNDGSWHQVSLMTIYDPVDHLVLGDKLEDMNCNSIYKFVISSNDLTDVYFEASVNKLLNIIPSDDELLFSSCANFDLYYEEDLLDSNPLFTVGDNHHAYYPSYIEYDPDPEAENMSENEEIYYKISYLSSLKDSYPHFYGNDETEIVLSEPYKERTFTYDSTLGKNVITVYVNVNYAPSELGDTMTKVYLHDIVAICDFYFKFYFSPKEDE